MLEVIRMSKADIKTIISWHERTSPEFLISWTGAGYTYPLTEEQLMHRFDANGSIMYKILLDDCMVGTMELFHIDHALKKATMGRFLLNSEYVNKDHGTEALKKFVNIVYSEVGITHIELTVSDQNKQAYRCYEKAGFVPTGKTAVRNDGSVSVWMDIKHEANQNLSL